MTLTLLQKIKSFLAVISIILILIACQNTTSPETNDNSVTHSNSELETTNTATQNEWLPVILSQYLLDDDDEPEEFTITGSYTGTYTCSQGLTGLTLDIVGTQSGDLNAVFNFYAVDSNPDVPSGSFNMEGSILPNNTFSLEATNWIDRPSGYRALDLSGTAFGGYQRLVGLVFGAFSCTTFNASRE